MAIKKPTTSSRSKSKGKAAPAPAPATKSRLQNLAAAKHSQPIDDVGEDGQPVDHSGVFRVTSAIQQAQIGHGDEDRLLRFASDSMAMAAQRDGFRDDGPTLDEAVEENSVEDEAARAERRARLATLAARARAQAKQNRQSRTRR
jgi:hypothetical protein